MLEGHGGNIYQAAKIAGCLPTEIVDLSSNISPFPLPKEIIDKLKERMGEICFLPEMGSEALVATLAETHGLSTDQILVGNGTTEFIYSIPRVLCPGSALILGPTYSDYGDACVQSSIKTSYCISSRKDSFAPRMDRLREQSAKADLVFICNPNNPTGAFIPKKELRDLAISLPSTIFLVDESYLPFVEHEDEATLLKGEIPGNLIVLRSFSKVYAIPGLRLGWLAASRETAGILREKTQPWSVNRLAQVAGQEIMESGEIFKKNMEFMAEEKKRFLGRAEIILNKPRTPNPVVLYPGTAYFVLLELKGPICAPDLARRLLRWRILIRDCSNFRGLGEDFVRISLKTREMNDFCLEVALEALGRGDEKIEHQRR